MCCAEASKNTKQTQLSDGYEYKKKVINKFAIQKQTNERENNKSTKRGQVLCSSAMCLLPWAKTPTNELNKCSEELQKRIFYKNPVSKYNLSQNLIRIKPKTLSQTK